VRALAFSPPLVLALVLAGAGGVSAISVAVAWRPGATPAPLPRRLEPDLNASPERHLLLLPGIGPVRARSIVEERERAGPFAGVEDIVRVHGIGPATAGALAGRARAGPAPGRRPPEPGAVRPAAAERP